MDLLEFLALTWPVVVAGIAIIVALIVQWRIGE